MQSSSNWILITGGGKILRMHSRQPFKKRSLMKKTLNSVPWQCDVISWSLNLEFNHSYLVESYLYGSRTPTVLIKQNSPFQTKSKSSQEFPEQLWIQTEYRAKLKAGVHFN